MTCFSEKMETVHSDIRGPLFYEALKLEKSGVPVLKLNTGNPASFGFEMPDSVSDALLAGAKKALGYCDFRGMPAARSAIAKYHSGMGIVGIDEDDVFVGNGVSEVVDFALQSMLNDGDEVLLPSPCYSVWSNSVRLCGGKPVYYTCDEGADWFPDCADIESKITDRTRAIVLINPNNPTGALYSKELLLSVAEIARRHGLPIFSDEIYDRLILDGKKFYSIAALAPDIPVITMNGLSKSHCLCGFRVGWMVLSGPKSWGEEYRKNLVKLTSLRLCSNALGQLVVPAALADTEYPDAMVREGGRLFEQRRATMDVLRSIPTISCVPNSAAFYVFPKLDVKAHNITDDRVFAHDLLHATGILVVPGSGFECDSHDHFRIVMLPHSAELSGAMHRLGSFLDGYRQR